MTEIGQLPVMLLRRPKCWSSAQSANQLDPRLEWSKALRLERREDPGLIAKDGRIARPDPAHGFTRNRMPTEKEPRLWKAPRPLPNRPLDAGDVGDDGARHGERRDQVENTGNRIDGRGDDDDIASVEDRDLGRCRLDRAPAQRLRCRTGRPCQTHDFDPLIEGPHRALPRTRWREIFQSTKG